MRRPQQLDDVYTVNEVDPYDPYVAQQEAMARAANIASRPMARGRRKTRGGGGGGSSYGYGGHGYQNQPVTVY